MRSARWYVALLAVVALTGCAQTGRQPTARASGPECGPTSGGPTPSVPVPQATTTVHALAPALAADGRGGLVLVHGAPKSDGELGALTSAYRSPDGTWGRPVTITASRADKKPPLLAVAADGSGVATWTETTERDHETTVAVWVSLRDASGDWSRAQRLASSDQIFGPEQAVANGSGDVAVLSAEGADVVYVHGAQGGWRRTVVPDGAAAIGLDDRGTVHALSTTSPHGGGGSVGTARLPRGGSWSATQDLTPRGGADESVLAVDPEGRENLAIGYAASGGYPVSADSDLVWPNAYRVLRQSEPGGAFRQVWEQQGVATLELSAPSGRLQVTWEQWSGHGPRNGPTRSALMTQTVLPELGPAHTLGSVANRLDADGVAVWRFQSRTVVDARGRGAVTWNAVRIAGSAPLQVTALDPAPRRTTRLDDQSREDVAYWSAVLASLATTPDGTAWVAWQHHLVGEYDADSGSPTYRDGSVSVASVPLD